MFKCLVEASSDNISLTCDCVPFPPSQVAEANVASNERAKRSKKKKKMEDGLGKVLLDSTPSRIYPFSHYICFLLFVFCLLPYRVLSPRILEDNRNTAEKGGWGSQWGSLSLGKQFSFRKKWRISVDLKLSLFVLFKGTVFCANVTVAFVYLPT